MSRRAFRASLAAVLFALPVTPLLGDDSGVSRARWHFVFDGTPAFRYSVLFSRGPKGDETRLLLESAAGRYELVSTQDPSGRDSTESVRALGMEKTVVRRLVLGGPAAAACEGLQAADACVILSGPGGLMSVPLSTFAGKEAAAVRMRAERIITSELRQRLEALAPLFGTTAELERYSGDFLALVWPETFNVPRGRLTKGTRTAGCPFDASFAHPCSEAELRREVSKYGFGKN